MPKAKSKGRLRRSCSFEYDPTKGTHYVGIDMQRYAQRRASDELNAKSVMNFDPVGSQAELCVGGPRGNQNDRSSHFNEDRPTQHNIPPLPAGSLQDPGKLQVLPGVMDSCGGRGADLTPYKED